jgi:hypothetical protein
MGLGQTSAQASTTAVDLGIHDLITSNILCLALAFII